jgi:hypothetical protein
MTDRTGRPDIAARIHELLGRLVDDPRNLHLHRELRDAALRRASAGGRPLGLFTRDLRAPRDPLRRLVHVERLWSFDPGNMNWLHEVVCAVEACAAANANENFDPVRRWLRRTLTAAGARV